MSECSKTLIIVNPLARAGEVGKKWAFLEKQLLEVLGEASVRVVFTSATDYGACAVSAALKDGIRKIVIVGGDGTISEAVQGFFENGKPIAADAVLAVMPAGRGDDFFKTMFGEVFYSSKKAWRHGLELLNSGKPVASDIGKVQMISEHGAIVERYFINIASFGYPGLVVKRVLSRSGKNAWTYLVNSATALGGYKPINIKVKVDGINIFDGPLFSGFILNGKYNAGGVCWSDEAKIDDGLFNIVLSEPRGMMATLCAVPRMFSGRWNGVKGVHLASGRLVEIFSTNNVELKHPLFEIDGDQPEPPATKKAIFEVLPQSLQIWR